jgi:DNA-binding cell septation regulator SpoVG
VTAVEVLTVRRVDKGTLRAVARVRLTGCIEIAGVRVLQEAGGDPWVAFPQVPARRRADGGGSGWSRIVEVVEPAAAVELREAVLAAWRTAPR